MASPRNAPAPSTAHEASRFVDPLSSPPLPAAALDVCHPGMVLRALLGVLALIALGSALGARDLGQAQTRLMEASGVAAPAVLAWLVGVCALRGWATRRAPARVMTVLVAWGALCALLSGAGWQQLFDGQNAPLQLGAFALSGAAAAALLLNWLRLRALAQGPQGMQARWVELQARIRPHFLFNTLNTAVALVRLDPQRAEAVLEDLAELFHAALAGPTEASTLAAEVELARRYLGIEQLRFGERLRVDWQLDAACAHARVPSLLLQPLVENAVRYGVEPNAEGGQLWVRTRRCAEGVEILVRNSLGAAAAAGGHGLALTNVRERLRLMHDVAGSLRLEPEAARFTVRITVPEA